MASYILVRILTVVSGSNHQILSAHDQTTVVVNASVVLQLSLLYDISISSLGDFQNHSEVSNVECLHPPDALLCHWQYVSALAIYRSIDITRV